MQAGENGISVRVHDENVWLTQKGMGELFGCSSDNVGLHLKKIFETGELDAEATTEKISVVRQEGGRRVSRQVSFYSLDAIISVGYRVNSLRATQFRQWATQVLKKFTVQGYVLDKQRLENGQVFDESHFDHLLDEIREIRSSKRKFYPEIARSFAESEFEKYRIIQDRLYQSDFDRLLAQGLD